MIACDWGTSSLRAYRLDAAGRVLDSRRSALGILAAAPRFAEVLAEQIAGWDEPLLLLSGMIGSRQGWVEMPYVPCPAGFADIAAGIREIEAPALPGRRLFLVPGLSMPGTGTAPDVMRGEETQICGLLPTLARGEHWVCLPGTHSKWARVVDGRVIEFQTAMTGELFDLLRRHSLLSRSMPDEAAFDPTAFSQGLDRAGQGGGLPYELFGVRARHLFGELAEAQLPSYLSGLLIGHELQGRPSLRGPVHLIGGEALLKPYSIALERRGTVTHCHREVQAANGMLAIARAAGLLEEKS